MLNFGSKELKDKTQNLKHDKKYYLSLDIDFPSLTIERFLFCALCYKH
jgi:hypothetical protein